VFEVCCEIFWLMLKFMRAPFKVSTRFLENDSS
jgi:Sec7-like guanine-nucleotide exchange factor